MKDVKVTSNAMAGRGDIFKGQINYSATYSKKKNTRECYTEQ
jgi:hypothetical protein